MMARYISSCLESNLISRHTKNNFYPIERRQQRRQQKRRDEERRRLKMECSISFLATIRMEISHRNNKTMVDNRMLIWIIFSRPMDGWHCLTQFHFQQFFFLSTFCFWFDIINLWQLYTYAHLPEFRNRNGKGNKNLKPKALTMMSRSKSKKKLTDIRIYSPSQYI